MKTCLLLLLHPAQAFWPVLCTLPLCHRSLTSCHAPSHRTALLYLHTDAKHVQSVLDRLQFVEGMHTGLLQSVGKAGEELHQSKEPSGCSNLRHNAVVQQMQPCSHAYCDQTPLMHIHCVQKGHVQLAVIKPQQCLHI